MTNTSGIPPHILRHFTENESWQVMPEAKANQSPSFYEFKPGMLKHQNFQDQELFQLMLQKFYHQTEVNKFLEPKSTTFKKDVNINGGSRATFDYDPDQKSYKTQPSAVIKKTRVDDLNLKAGKRTQICNVLSS